MGAEVSTGYWNLDLETWELKVCPLSREMLGLPLAESGPLPRTQWASRIHPDDLVSMTQQIWITAEKRDHSFSQSFRSIRHDGTVRQILGVGNTLPEGGAEPRRLIGSNIDLVSAAKIVTPSEVSPWASGEVQEIDGRVANDKLGALQSRTPVSGSGDGHESAVREILRKRGRDIIKMRRARAGYFHQTMIGEPAFDILLVMYSAGTPREPFSLNALTSALDLSTSQAHRWLTYLQEQGFVHFDPSIRPQGIAHPSLTSRGMRSVSAFLEFVVTNSTSKEAAGL